jgi:hypothetical protein
MKHLSDFNGPGAMAQNDTALRQSVGCKEMIAADHPWEFTARELRLYPFAPRGQNDLLGRERLLSDLDFAGSCDFSAALDQGDLVFCEKPLNALTHEGD